MKRSLLSKDLQKTIEFIVENKTTNKDEKNKSKAIPFTISPETLTNIKEKGNVPKFKIKGKLTSSVLNITEPLTGELMVESCDAQIKSIEIHYRNTEYTDIADGDVSRGLLIPIYMIFPRLFTCPTLSTNNFKIDFEINVVVVFRDDHLVTENFPIKLVRY
ncbi:Hypothetical predicted protein [Mytilus galloprovincialis]|uniref:Uncharacterized protein n=1 Tax=Mytilus galloprovincialis TaxID=29158 RepID=A0A8B6F367_MYTGA|nr:Hypothetical predicted protein [Mytilus galloprovincialis]